MTREWSLGATTRLPSNLDARVFRHKFRIEVLAGPDQGRGITSAEECTTIGSAQQNDLVLSDRSVSRHHLRIEIADAGFVLTDLDSTNGTTAGTMEIRQAVAKGPMELRLGDTLLRFSPLAERVEVELPAATQFGAVVGQSPVMRELFRRMESASKQNMTVLIEGETGTGKELIAQELHRQSPRADGPFVIVDCGAIPESLIESELFGHVRGAFTGATGDRIGAFEEASGGTVFLDEIGELDLSLQPRLLRVLERGQVKRLGQAHHRELDVRVLAATNRDLQRCVNQGSFRADLYYRLAVVHLRVPPLRQRGHDLELLVDLMLPQLATNMGMPDPPGIAARTLERMKSYPWPGNVRELRNFLARIVTMSRGDVFYDPLSELSESGVSHTPDEVVSAVQTQWNDLPFKEAKAKCLAEFELNYLKRLLRQSEHNVAEAARQSGIDRVHVHRLIKKYGLRRG